MARVTRRFAAYLQCSADDDSTQMNLVSKWLVRLIPGGRSVQAVAAHLQQAEQLRASGRASEALGVALEGLSLRKPPLPPTSGAADLISLVSLTILAEELATQLGVPGANDRDILESVARLRYWDEAVDRFPDLERRRSAEVR